MLCVCLYVSSLFEKVGKIKKKKEKKKEKKFFQNLHKESQIEMYCKSLHPYTNTYIHTYV